MPTRAKQTQRPCLREFPARRASARQVCIAIVGKYNRGTDAYLSIVRALGHAAVHANRKLEYRWVDSEHLQDEATEEERTKAQEELDRCDGILVPGGFGDRGIEGKIRACRYARETLKPFLGICLGLQVRSQPRAELVRVRVRVRVCSLSQLRGAGQIDPTM
jgi:CTP synthase